MKPFLPYYLRNLKRGPAVILPKDSGLIITLTGLNRNSRVLECGGGSGFLTITLARIVKKVYTYERRELFYNIIKENLEKRGIKNVILKNKDIFKGVKEKNLDCVILDMLNSYDVIEIVKNSIKKGGFLVGYLPTIEQARKFYDKLKENNFNELLFFTVKKEDYQIGKGTRPKNINLNFTAYIVMGRK